MLYLALYIRFGSPAASNNASGTPAGGIVGIVFIYLYAFGWSFGHSVACYVVAAEIFPARIVSTLSISTKQTNGINVLQRSFCMRLVTCPASIVRECYLLSQLAFVSSSTGLLTTGSLELLLT